MFRKSLLCLALLACTLQAASLKTTFHKDHRSHMVKLDLVQTTSAKRNLLKGEELALFFLQKNARRYGIESNFGDLELTKVKESLVGSHYYFQQSLNGYKVQGAEIIVSLSHETGHVYMVYNNTYPADHFKKAPLVNLDEEDAFEIAWQDLRVHGPLIATPRATLVYVPEDADFHLVYLVDYAVEAPFGYWEHRIDAASGEVLDARRTSISREPMDDLDFDHYQGPIWDRAETLAAYHAELGKRKAAQTTTKAPANGSATVFDPDPVTTLQNDTLEDNSPASSFSAAYVTRTLQDIDLNGGTYRLNGPWVTIANFESPNTAPSTTTNGQWTATRGNNSFNDAMTYFHLDQNQRYMQSLGFTGATGIQELSINVDADGLSGGDNSHYIPSTNRIAFGHGCVDDNEDMFVILHEYGHAIHYSINSNWSGGDTGGMGEGFGDYWAGSYRYSTPNGASFHPEWAFPWDGHNNCWGGRDMDQTQFQYNPSATYPAHATVGGVYSDELWSTPLFQSLVTLTGQGVPRSEVDQIVLQAHFGLGGGLSMRDMATSIVNTAGTLYPSGPHASVFQQKFEDQNILAGGPPTGPTELTNGETRSSLSGATGAEDHYFIQVPVGATNLSASISGGSGDADLYLRFGAQPTTASYDCRPYLGGNNETCNVASPNAGSYYIMIRAYSTYAGVTLTVSYTDPAGNQDPNADFSFTTSNLLVDFTDASSDPDGTIASYDWDFGDSNSSTQADPSHTYASAGSYNVTLTVTDNQGATDNISKNVTVTSGGGGTWTELSNTDFESGWGPFTDGGSDCRRSANDSSFAHQGTYCARIRDNSGQVSSFYSTNNTNLSSYSELRVNFWYRAASMEINENFFVEFFDGSTWQVIGNFVRGTDFDNGPFYNPEIVIDSSTYNFGTANKLRFRCDASGNGDKVYIDEVVISAR